MIRMTNAMRVATSIILVGLLLLESVEAGE